MLTFFSCTTKAHSVKFEIVSAKARLSLHLAVDRVEDTEGVSRTRVAMSLDLCIESKRASSAMNLEPGVQQAVLPQTPQRDGFHNTAVVYPSRSVDGWRKQLNDSEASSSDK